MEGDVGCGDRDVEVMQQRVCVCARCVCDSV
jgi:hypothetical protein